MLSIAFATSWALGERLDFVGLSQATDVGRRGDVHWLAGELAHSGGDSHQAEVEFARAARIWVDPGGRSPSKRIPSDSQLIGTVGSDSDATSVATLLALGGHPRLLGREAAETVGVGRTRGAFGLLPDLLDRAERFLTARGKSRRPESARGNRFPWR